MNKPQLRLAFYFFIVLFLTAAAQAQDVPKIISAGVLNGKAISLVKPPYPAAAKAVRAAGTVNVQVLIDEQGSVVSATATSGHPLLRAAAVQAARASKFTPTSLSGQLVKVNGVIVYNFISEIDWFAAGLALGDAETEIDETNRLEALTSDLAGEFPTEAEAIEIVVANLKNSDDSARIQTAAINQIINSMRSKIAKQKEDARQFELGLTIGRLQASPLDDVALQTNLPKLKELLESVPPENSERESSIIKRLSEFANKTSFMRKDRRIIAELLEEL